jgi:hypothetical protein
MARQLFRQGNNIEGLFCLCKTINSREYLLVAFFKEIAKLKHLCDRYAMPVLTDGLHLQMLQMVHF